VPRSARLGVIPDICLTSANPNGSDPEGKMAANNKNPGIPEHMGEPGFLLYDAQA
jgi:hypothetical protein